MTAYYIDIKILSDAEFSHNILLSSLYMKLHKYLFELKKNIGVSFPAFKKDLGNILRIHGSKDDLNCLMQLNWVGSLFSFLEFSEILEVPNSTKYRIVSRVQNKSSVERLYRRSLRNNKITKEEALIRLQKLKDLNYIRTPFIEMRSNSSRQRFKLFIEHGKVLDSPLEGNFSSYGLSNTATIPWFL